MTKRLLIFSVAVSFLLAAPLYASAGTAELQPVEQVQDEDISISVNGQSVLISGAQGQTLEVVSLTGRRLLTLKIESPAQRVELNVPKGCYILKVGKVVRKVAIH